MRIRLISFFQVFFLAYGSTLLVTDNYGFGKHLWNVKLSDYVMFVKVAETGYPNLLKSTLITTIAHTG